MLTVSLVTLGSPDTLTGGYLYHRRVAERAPRHGARVGFVSVPAWRFPLPLLAGPRVLAELRARCPDVVLVDSIAAAYVGPWAGRVPVPLAGIVHQPPGGMDAGPLRSTAQARLDRLLYARCRRLVVASRHLRDTLVAGGLDAGRLEVVVPGRDPATPDRPLPDLRGGRGCGLLSVGNWAERKGLLDLLEAFAGLPGDSATLHLAGRTDVEPAYARRVWRRLRRSDVAGRVVVHGPLSAGGVAAMYAAADAFVLPSRREPYGTVYGEAMAAGLPVVGWRAGNLPYLADHDVEGLLVAPGDIPALSEALQRLVGDPGLRQRLGQAAARRAARLPTWDDTTAALVAVLRQVAG